MNPLNHGRPRAIKRPRDQENVDPFCETENPAKRQNTGAFGGRQFVQANTQQQDGVLQGLAPFPNLDPRTGTIYIEASPPQHSRSRGKIRHKPLRTVQVLTDSNQQPVVDRSNHPNIRNARRLIAQQQRHLPVPAVQQPLQPQQLVPQNVAPAAVHRTARSSARRLF